MYDYIRGVLTYISSGTMVIESQGLGFSILLLIDGLWNCQVNYTASL